MEWAVTIKLDLTIVSCNLSHSGMPLPVFSFFLATFRTQFHECLLGLLASAQYRLNHNLSLFGDNRWLGLALQKYLFGVLFYNYDRALPLYFLGDLFDVEVPGCHLGRIVCFRQYSVKPA